MKVRSHILLCLLALLPLGAYAGAKVTERHEIVFSEEGRARDTAKEIAKVLKQRFQEQGWIEGAGD